MVNPVHFDPETNAWWFYDETWADRLGPYPDEQTAERRCRDYAVYLNTGVDPGVNDNPMKLIEELKDSLDKAMSGLEKMIESDARGMGWEHPRVVEEDGSF